MEKHREIFNRSSTFNCYKVSCKEPAMRHGRSGVGRGDPSAGGLISWPPIRLYSCSFCKREFRSAQALGGHMNVHRRDRARLRHYSPPWDPSPSNPNPNPNLISSNCVPNLNMPPPSDPTFSCLLSPATPLSCSSSSARGDGLSGGGNFMEVRGKKDGMALRKETADHLVHLDLDMGISCGDLDDSLDLELRLGCT